jgi:MarR family transcriptional regulator, organic hydroperoxide resistance regulator
MLNYLTVKPIIMNKNSDIEQFFSITMQFGKLISRYTQETHEEKNATMLQLIALEFLKEQPNGTVSELAEFLKLSKSSTTQLTERLVKANLAERIHDKEDRRIVRLVITNNGEKKFVALKKELMGKMKKVFYKVPSRDLRELIRIFTNLTETLKKEQYEQIKANL